MFMTYKMPLKVLFLFAAIVLKRQVAANGYGVRCTYVRLPFSYSICLVLASTEYTRFAHLNA